MKVVFMIGSVEKTNTFFSNCLLDDCNKMETWGYFYVDFFIWFYAARVKCASNQPSKQNIYVVFGKWKLFNCVGQGNLSDCCMNWAMQFMLWLSKWLPVHWKWFKLWKMKNFHWHQYSFKLTIPDPAQSKAVWIWYLGPGLKPDEKKYNFIQTFI